MAVAAAGLAASAIYVRDETIRAERDYPSTGKFMTVRGVRLHFIDTGGIEPVLVLLHGNGADGRRYGNQRPRRGGRKTLPRHCL